MVSLTPTELALGLVVLVLLIALLIMGVRMRQTAGLKSRFGPEYDRTVKEIGNDRKAAAVLQERQKRVAAFSIKPLSAGQSASFIEAWQKVQAQFVDDPKGAVAHGDVLLGEVMEARGYPVTDFEQRSADLSVDHPTVVQNYRTAHDIAIRHARGEADTEELRQAMIHYRTLFEELVEERTEVTRSPRVEDLQRETAHD